MILCRECKYGKRSSKDRYSEGYNVGHCGLYPYIHGEGKVLGLRFYYDAAHLKCPHYANTGKWIDKKLAGGMQNVL